MSNIEWTDKTWNPVTGCTKVSPGCKNCYAEGIADRFFAKQYPPNQDGSERKFTDVRCHEARLEEPFRWKKPCRVFVNSMSDLFHENIPEDFIGHVFAVMAQCPQHVFQILTKRPAEMLDLVGNAQQRYGPFDIWPLPNVWLGVSVEDKKRKDRIALLRQTPAAVRFLSIEPQLEDVGSLELGDKDCNHPSLTGIDTSTDPLKVWRCGICEGLFHQCDKPTIDWVICGGESGPGARPFNLAWAESLLQQCQSAGVPFFMKQVGRVPIMERERWLKHHCPLTDANMEDPYWLNAHNDKHAPEGTVALLLEDCKGGSMEEWPKSLRVRQFPSPQMELAK